MSSDNRPTSETRETSWPEESLIGSSHHETKIRDSRNSVTGYGRSSEESQRRASEKWDHVKEGRSGSGSNCGGK